MSLHWLFHCNDQRTGHNVTHRQTHRQTQPFIVKGILLTCDPRCWWRPRASGGDWRWGLRPDPARPAGTWRSCSQGWSGSPGPGQQSGGSSVMTCTWRDCLPMSASSLSLSCGLALRGAGRWADLGLAGGAGQCSHNTPGGGRASGDQHSHLRKPGQV